MTAMALRVISLMRVAPRSRLGLCSVCQRAIRTEDERLRLPDGKTVHRGCSTYRMRQRDMIARRLR